MKTARACLAFARDRANLLRSLSRRDVEVVIENGSAFLFRNGQDSARKMRNFLGNDETNVLESDKASTVDLMRFLLSCTSNPAVFLERNYNKEIVESSVRSLLCELANASYSAPQLDLPGSGLNQSPESYGQTQKSFRQNIEMKRGDWNCPRCNFMNFARNMKCLECEEARPKRQLTGGEWECPQCDFFNYGRNVVCLRCDCKRPGEVSFNTTSIRSGSGYGNGNYANKVNVDSRLAANEEKAERWFSKVSQLDSTSDMNSGTADEDFPEIMPLRKGVNRFVVSTRKTPLERRLANAQYQNDGTSEGNNLQTGGVNQSLDTTISRSLDEILGHTSGAAQGENKRITTEQNAGTQNPGPVSSSTTARQYGQLKGGSSNYVPFVPLPADMFSKKPQSSNTEENEKLVTDNYKPVASEASEQKAPASRSNPSGISGDGLLLSQKPVTQIDSNREKEQAEKSERWFKKVAELHDVTDLASAISDEDFPEIMPMRKGENRFVVSKKKDRSLTSPMYKRRMAMEQTSSTNFVPFVPFPPDHFAKKDNQQPDGADSSKATGETSVSVTSEKVPEKADDSVPDRDYKQPTENQQSNAGIWSTSGENSAEGRTGNKYGTPINENSTTDFVSPQTNNRNSWSSGGHAANDVRTETANTKGSLPPSSENQNPRNSWAGKSLEGSAVKETDPLDMSEEAKAERWFRRAAQIKDISELSQIPDEDFPSIMPMRKGVNRFVVSKRKTPLERRLTSPQYRRNLPIVTSDPLKKEED